MLSIGLSLIGILLILNGLIPMLDFERRSLAIYNTVIGIMIALFGFYLARTATTAPVYVECIGSLLFGLSFLAIAASLIWTLDYKHFGIFSIIAALIAIVIGIYYLYTGSVYMGIAWFVFSVLWIFSFIAFAVVEDFKTVCYWSYLIVGIAALVLSLLIATNIIKIAI
jgi:hypothetical protein